MSFTAVILKVSFNVLTLILSLKCLGWELSPRDSCKTKLMQVIHCDGGHMQLGIAGVNTTARGVWLSWPRGQLVKRTELRHPKLVLRPIRCDHHHHQFLSSLESRFMEISTVFKVTRITFPIAMRKFIPNKHSPFLSPYLLIPTYPHLPNLFALTNRLPLFIVEEKKEGSFVIWQRVYVRFCFLIQFDQLYPIES